jgi:hypothetical protein
MRDTLAYLRLNDLVEDRSLSHHTGHIVYLRGNVAWIRFPDGSEEVVNADLFIHHDERRWII